MSVQEYKVKLSILSLEKNGAELNGVQTQKFSSAHLRDRGITGLIIVAIRLYQLPSNMWRTALFPLFCQVLSYPICTFPHRCIHRKSRLQCWREAASILYKFVCLDVSIMHKVLAEHVSRCAALIAMLLTHCAPASPG